MIKSIAIATVLASMMGCAYGPKTNDNVTPGYTYSVVIDPTFSDMDDSALLQGLSDWTTVSGGLIQFNSTIGICGAPASMTICVTAASAATFLTVGGEADFIGLTVRNVNYTESSTVYIPVSQDVHYVQYQMTTIFSHEIGHALGEEHIQATNSGVMYYSIQGATITPTCVDYAQYVSNHSSLDFVSNPACAGKNESYTLDLNSNE